MQLYLYSGQHKDQNKNPREFWYVCASNNENAVKKLEDNGVVVGELLEVSLLGKDWR